jgi:hypothetical protein
MHFIRTLTLFICCVISGVLGTGLIILNMYEEEIVLPELDRVWVGFTILFFFAVFVVEMTLTMNNDSVAYNKKGPKNETNS